MNIYDLFFIIYVLGFIGITGVKFWNIMSLNEKYGLKMSIILFCAYLILWLIGFSVFAFQPLREIYHIFFTLGSWLMMLNVLFFFAELFMTFRTMFEGPIKPRMSRELQRD